MAPHHTPLRVALIGCGRISTQHVASVDALSNDLKLVAVCDVKPDRAEVYARRYGIPAYTAYEKLLTEVSADLVAVATPNGLHCPIGLAVAHNGSHLLMEKPLTITLEETDQLIRAFKNAGRFLFAVKQVRYNPPIQALKRAIEEGRIGKILSATLTMRWARPQEYYDQDEWRGTKTLDGGSLLNQGIHYIDALQWFLGPARTVFGKTDTVAHKIDIEDVAQAIITFQNGAYGVVEFSVCTYPRNLECSITVMGTKGTVKLGGSAVNEIELWEVENFPRPVLPPGLLPNVYAGGLYQGSCPNHVYVYQNIIDVLKNHGKVHTDGEEARKSMELVYAIYRSAETGKEVALPLSA